MKLKAYPAMKDSGVPWLGEVPEHWEVRRIKTLFREKDERNGSSDAVLLSLTRSKGIVPQAEASSRIASTEDLSKYKVCRPGDLAMNRMQAWSGMFALSTYSGVVSPDYSVFGALAEAEVKFFEHLFKTPLLVDQFAQRSKGIGSGFNRLYTPDFGTVPAVVPPLPEQTAIVRFLDHADRRIRRYIRAKQKLIKLLEEQKQAIIHRAVTRGPDPNVRLKPSGVEWLGDVPEHWEVMRLARVIADGPRNGISPPVDERGTIESFSISAIRGGEVDVREGDKKYISGDKAYLESVYCLLPGDVLLVRGNGNIRLVGRAGLVERDMPNRVYPDLLMRLRLTHRCLPAFLVALLNCPAGRDQIETAARTAVGTFKINNQQVRQLCFALPPATEQQRTVDWLSDELSAIKAALYRADDEIDLLREYRTRLIADVVTGKLDVREAVAHIPDESAEPEVLAEPEPSTEAGGDTVDDLDVTPEEAEA